jgi:hypothetical protein
MDTSIAVKIDDPKILALRAKVRAAQEEFDTAMACHETWKPAAYDEKLHERIGRSYAANTFRVVRQALRREMLLALTRLWDKDSRAVGMTSIANTLRDGRIMDALAAECEGHWDDLHLSGLEDIPEEQRASVVQAARRSETEFGREQSAALRQRAADAISIIGNYAEGGSRHATLKRLMTLRNEHLAHRQVTPTPVEVTGADATDEEIEAVYQDMSRLVCLLRGSVDNTHYDPEATAEIRRRHAALFWVGVRGERTEGHPDYRPAPRGFDPSK